MAVHLTEDWKKDLQQIIREELQTAAVEVSARVCNDMREELGALRRIPPDGSPTVVRNTLPIQPRPSLKGWMDKAASTRSHFELDNAGEEEATTESSSPILEKGVDIKTTALSNADGSRSRTGSKASQSMERAASKTQLEAPSTRKTDAEARLNLMRTVTANILEAVDREAPAADDEWAEHSMRGYMATKAIKSYPMQNEVLKRANSQRKLSGDGSPDKISTANSMRGSSKQPSGRKTEPSELGRRKSSKDVSAVHVFSSEPAIFPVCSNGNPPENSPRCEDASIMEKRASLEDPPSEASENPDLLFMDRFASTHMANMQKEPPALVDVKRSRDMDGQNSQAARLPRGASKVSGRSSSGDPQREETNVMRVVPMGSLFPRLKPQMTKALPKTIPRAMTKALSSGSRITNRCYVGVAKFVTDPRFDVAISVLLVLNAASIGAQVDYMARNDVTTLPVLFVILGWIFVIIFTMELSLRLFVHGRNFFVMPGWQWNIFDAVVVTLQLTEELMATVVDQLMGELYANFTVARLLRSVRLVRVIRFVRIVRLIRELRTMVASIAGSLRTFMWTIALLLLMIYIIGVYITQLVVDYRSTNAYWTDEETEIPQLTRYYGSLGDSVLSLFQAMSGGIDWDDLLGPLRRAISPVMAILFAFYIAFAMFVMLNLVTGIFVESAQSNIKEDKDLDLVNRVRELFITADEDYTGCITWCEFNKQLGSPQMEEYFRSIDLDLSEAAALFSLLDIHGTGKITSEDFLNGCLRLRGTARAIDLTTLVHNMKRMYKQWISSSKRIERQVTFLSKSLSTLLDEPFDAGYTVTACGN